VAAVLHKIEALAGDGRYAVTFQRADRSEQTAVVQVAGDDVTAAEASLPDGWTTDSDSFRAMAEAVLAVQRARSAGPKAAALTDVAGGWDVMMGNVVLSDTGVPTCTAHGELVDQGGGRWECPECGALASYER
jgi:hypothetical protein